MRAKATLNHGMLMLLAICVGAFVLGCKQVPENTVPQRAPMTAAEKESYESKVREGRGAFLKEPRSIKTCEISAKFYKEAIALKSDEYNVLWEAARTAVWLGNFGPEAKAKDHVKDGLTYANTAVKVKPNGEEGLFYHGALAGMLADLEMAYGPDAIETIESRMKKLIEMKSTYLFGGPDRILGTLYMRAPGAPLSVGDFDKALTHMSRALEIEPHWPENQLYMAELEFRLAKKTDDPAYAKKARARLEENILGSEAKAPMGTVYEFKAWQEDARKLLEDNK
ncbi:MAG: hypothetical protein KBG84_00325 [Planctomycetes bacterium]|nr:hypothetical protein [Planctomycetota bacterium]